MKKKVKNRIRITFPYCGTPAIFRNGSFVYGEDSLVDKLYVCIHYPQCNAYVGVFKDTDVPKGTLQTVSFEIKEFRHTGVLMQSGSRVL